MSVCLSVGTYLYKIHIHILTKKHVNKQLEVCFIIISSKASRTPRKKEVKARLETFGNCPKKGSLVWQRVCVRLCKRVSVGA